MDSLYNIALEKVLKQGIPYGHLTPHPVVKDVTQFFFREMFVELVDQFEELVYVCSDPDADEEDKSELLRRGGEIYPKHMWSDQHRRAFGGSISAHTL